MNREYWNNRYQNNQTGWDIGGVSGPMKELISEITDKSAKILIPGCGNAYEALYLNGLGYENVFLCEISDIVIKAFKKNNPHFPAENCLNIDFFELEGEFDVILEQTFFCAISPDLRDQYVLKIHELLSNNGVLLGVLFNQDFSSGPPFGGSTVEYKKRFEKLFRSVHIEACISSITPRMGNEVLIRVHKS